METRFMPVETPEEASTFIRKWMEDSKVFKSESSNGAFFFQYDGNVAGEIEFSIQQPKELVRVIGVLSRMAIDPEHLEKLSAVDEKAREKIFADIAEYLIFLPPNFAFEPTPGNPKSIFFVKEITYDELTEGRLNAAMNQICRGLIFTSNKLTEKLGELAAE
jgi:hypothetical protein